MNMDKVFKVDEIGTNMINQPSGILRGLCELFDVDPDKNPSILKIYDGNDFRHVIFWSENRSYYEKAISEKEYEALKNAGFPCGL